METERLIELVVMARQGDEKAMETLYLDAKRSVYYLALRMVKNPEDAEDITQEVFITVQEKISDLREPAAFYKWLNRITASKCTDLLRKYQGIVKLDDEDEFLSLVDDDPTNLPDKAIDDADTRKIILEVIDSLPDGQRVCVILYYYQQNTISQIAGMLDLNENTVKSRLALARAKIRAALEEKEKKEGIKLYGIPLALTPILRQAMEQFTVPADVSERMWENIQKAVSEGAPANGGPGADQPGGSGTSGQSVPKSGGIQPSDSAEVAPAASAAEQAATGAGMALATKIIIGIIAAAVVTAGAIVIPRLMNTPPNEAPPPAVTDTQTTAPDDTGQSDISNEPQSEGGIYEIDGGTYEGELVDGQRSGWGVWVYENYRYEGWWENDMPNGEGTLHITYLISDEMPSDRSYPQGEIIQATFKDAVVDGAVSETHIMSQGDNHYFSYNLPHTGATEDFDVDCDCGEAQIGISKNQIRGVAPWLR